MWKKEEPPTPAPPIQPERKAAPLTPIHRAGERAAIGRAISIRGAVTGEEDLLIQGRVDGTIDLLNNVVTVGSDGEVSANVNARVVVVEGTVEGDIHGEEQVVLRATARVQGDITSPRLVLEDGARFRGGVEMGDVPGLSDDFAAMQPKLLENSQSVRRDDAKNASTASGSSSKQETRVEGGASGSGDKRKGSPELFAEARS